MTYEYEMTLKFKLRSDKPLDPRFALALRSLFNDYEDGRYPFEVEQMQNGLSDCMKRAAREALHAAMQEQFGREVVESEDGTGCTSLWYLEATMREPVVPYVNEEPTVSIERVNVKPFHDRHMPRRDGPRAPEGKR